MWRNQNPCMLLVGMWNDATAVENSLAVLQTVKSRILIWPKYSTFMYVPKRIENRYSSKHLYMNTHSSSYVAVYISWKTETTHMYSSWWVDNRKVVYPYNGVLFRHKNEVPINATKCVKLKNFIMLSEGS